MPPTDAPNCRLEVDDASIAWLYLDCQDGDANILSLPVLRELQEAVEELERREDLRGLVVLSAKDAGFATGPSTADLSVADDTQPVDAFIQLGQSVMNRIAALTVPTVALIRGQCLSSGLELALACRYRVADRSGATLGFPDVRVGVHPCHGGTARLPALVGSWRALELIRGGASVNATRAARLKLVDAAVAKDTLRDTALDFIDRDPGRPRPGLWHRLLLRPAVRRRVYKMIDSELQRKGAENYPATYAVLRLWRDHAGKPLAEQLTAERESLLDLLRDPTARNLVRTYMLRDRLRGEARALDAPLPDQVHVFGAGTIGAGLAVMLALHGRRVTLHDPDAKALRAAESRAQTLFNQHLDDADRIAEARERLQAGDSNDGLGDAAFVIEAIHEDAAAKQALLKQIEGKLGPDVVIASATTLHLETLSHAMERPQRLIGLHCFRPVERMPLIEVVDAGESSEAALAAGQALVASVQKLPLRVRGTPGFLVRRLQLRYMLQGADGFDLTNREIIDTAGRRFGMPHGPLELADTVGLDVCQQLAERLDYPVPKALSDRVKAGRLGQRTNQGFHEWSRGHHVYATISEGPRPWDEITRKLIDPVVQEAERCRDEQVAADADLVDVGALFGIGFPARTGGPLNLLQERESGYARS